MGAVGTTIRVFGYVWLWLAALILAGYAWTSPEEGFAVGVVVVLVVIALVPGWGLLKWGERISARASTKASG